MAATLTITDALDGTGGTATVSGSAVGSSNTLYRTPWTGAAGAQSWTASGSRTGDGTITLSSPTVPLGHYLWRLDSLLSGVTEVATYYGALSDATEESLHNRILDAVKTLIDELTLPMSCTILKRWVPVAVPDVDDSNLPMVAVSPFGMESNEPMMSSTDDIVLPVTVVLIAKQNQDNTANLNRNLLWRWKIRRKLENRSLAGIPEVLKVGQPSGPVFDLGQWRKQFFFSPLLFPVSTRTTRG